MEWRLEMCGDVVVVSLNAPSNVVFHSNTSTGQPLFVSTVPETHHDLSPGLSLFSCGFFLSCNNYMRVYGGGRRHNATSTEYVGPHSLSPRRYMRQPYICWVNSC